MKKYYEAIVLKSNSGFGFYQIGEYNGDGYEKKADLIQAIANGTGMEIYEIGTDKLPDGISDISGKIYGKFDFIVGWLENNEPRYESIIEKEVGDEI